MNRILQILLICCLLNCGTVLSAAGELRIIVTGDIHGKLDRFSRLASTFRAYPDALKIDLGDLFHGDPLCDLLDGAPMIRALNGLNFDIYIPGNHEFELSPGKLKTALTQFKGSLLGQWQLPGLNVRSWKMFSRNGFRCAVIGTTDNGIWRSRSFYPELKIVEEMQAIKMALDEIRPLAPDLVVLARHGGNYFSGITLGGFLRKYPEIDLMLCSHSHKEIAGQRSGKVLIVQPGAYAASAVLVTARRIAARDIHIQSRLLRAVDKPDPEIEAVFKTARRQKHSQLVCRVLNISSYQDLGQKCVEKIRAAVKTDCAVTDLPELSPGSYTVERFLTAFPYRNRIATVKMNHREYRKLLREKTSAGRKRFASDAPENKENFTVAVNTFILSRSPELRHKKDFQLTGMIERDLIPGTALVKTVDKQRIFDRSKIDN